jgi:hypothetical protein
MERRATNPIQLVDRLIGNFYHRAAYAKLRRIAAIYKGLIGLLYQTITTGYLILTARRPNFLLTGKPWEEL